MRLLLDDALTTAPLVYPLSASWVDGHPEVEIAVETGLAAGAVQAGELALLPAAEVTLLQASHQVVPDVGVVAGNSGAVAMRCPVRPDEIGLTTVRLWEINGTAELLARATLHAFYGIYASSWTRDDAPEAEVAIVDGANAIVPPEAGYSEDLCRAWVILTSFRAVDQVLVAPRSLTRADVGPVLDLFAAAKEIGHERRRELRRAVAERYGISDRDHLAAVMNEYSYSVGPDEQRSLLDLLRRGTAGSPYPPPQDVAFMPPARG